MAIQFPPIVASDPIPQDGDTYLNLLTQQEYVCHKDTPDSVAQWTAIGAVPDTTFGHRGTVEILSQHLPVLRKVISILLLTVVLPTCPSLDLAVLSLSSGV